MSCFATFGYSALAPDLNKKYALWLRIDCYIDVATLYVYGKNFDVTLNTNTCICK